MFTRGFRGLEVDFSPGDCFAPETLSEADLANMDGPYQNNHWGMLSAGIDARIVLSALEIAFR